MTTYSPKETRRLLDGLKYRHPMNSAGAIAVIFDLSLNLEAAQVVIEKQRAALLQAETALAVATGVIDRPIRFSKVLAVVNDALRLTEDET